MNFSQEQLKIIVKALDLYTRVGLGQFEEVSYVYQEGSSYHDEELHELFLAAKEKAGHPKNGSYGIHNLNVPASFKEAFKLKQEIALNIK